MASCGLLRNGRPSPGDVERACDCIGANTGRPRRHRRTQHAVDNVHHRASEGRATAGQRIHHQCRRLDLRGTQRCLSRRATTNPTSLFIHPVGPQHLVATRRSWRGSGRMETGDSGNGRSLEINDGGCRHRSSRHRCTGRRPVDERRCQRT